MVTCDELFIINMKWLKKIYFIFRLKCYYRRLKEKHCTTNYSNKSNDSRSTPKQLHNKRKALKRRNQPTYLQDNNSTSKKYNKDQSRKNVKLRKMNRNHRNDDNDNRWCGIIDDWEFIDNAPSHFNEEPEIVHKTIAKSPSKRSFSNLILCRDEIENGLCLTRHYYNLLYHERGALGQGGEVEGDQQPPKSLRSTLQLELKKSNNIRKYYFPKDVKRLFRLDDYNNILLNIDHIEETIARTSYLLPSDLGEWKKTEADTWLKEYLVNSCSAEDALLTIDRPRTLTRWYNYRRLWNYFKRFIRIVFKCCK